MSPWEFDIALAGQLWELVGDEKEGSNCSVNLIQSSTSANVNLLEKVERLTHVNPSSTNVQSGKEIQSLVAIM